MSRQQELSAEQRAVGGSQNENVIFHRFILDHAAHRQCVHALDCTLLTCCGDFLVIKTHDFLEDLFGVLAEERRAANVSW